MIRLPLTIIIIIITLYDVITICLYDLIWLDWRLFQQHLRANLYAAVRKINNTAQFAGCQRNILRRRVLLSVKLTGKQNDNAAFSTCQTCCHIDIMQHLTTLDSRILSYGSLCHNVRSISTWRHSSDTNQRGYAWMMAENPKMWHNYSLVIQQLNDDWKSDIGLYSTFPQR